MSSDDEEPVFQLHQSLAIDTRFLNRVKDELAREKDPERIARLTALIEKIEKDLEETRRKLKERDPQGYERLERSENKDARKLS